ncbi:hypothetical protein SAMN05216298_4683 [Glycomyces sambucus]|uniref:AbiV family abortive infection protein n=1 Tax=Glycomyces sambucus TaxID=380244 RepID=A0A1G9LXI7_9ACTN|nr:hypothetical protein [Glycomyces sambucus]SDL66135.1 hypothetical protein SAMN05216298_4683 [Glycomyces sambucus]
MVLPNLNQKQTIALLQEMTSTRNLLAYGIRVVRTGAFVETTRDPILTMLSIGVEKLYKLTLGLIALDVNQQWPSAAVMRDHGHKLGDMHQKVIAELRERTRSKSQYVRGLLAEVEADPVVIPVIEALDMYGRRGRFYYLDQLGESPQPVSPDEAWQRIELAALTDPDVAALYSRANATIGNNEVWNEFKAALNERIAVAVERIWIMIFRSGMNHALGETGTTFGFEIQPSAVGRQ